MKSVSNTSGSTKIFTSKRKTSTINIFLSLIAVVTFAYLYFAIGFSKNLVVEQSKQDFDNRQQIDHMSQTQSQKFPRVVPRVKVVLLLQPSPVASAQQIDRLKVIDSTWASWRGGLGPDSFVIYASGALDLFRTSHPFLNINTIPLDSQQDKHSPFKNMLQSFYELITSQSQMSWLIYGNDHSFFVPTNLYCFLNSLDKDLAIYTGNKLQRGMFNDFKLYFASGGAGCVASHVALKMFMISLALNRNVLLQDLLIDVNPLTSTQQSQQTRAASEGHQCSFRDREDFWEVTIDDASPNGQCIASLLKSIVLWVSDEEPMPAQVQPSI